MANSGKNFRESGGHCEVLSGKDGCKLRRLSFLLLVVCLFGSVAIGQPWDGGGVEGDPYLIYTPADMQAIGADANYWDAHFKLMVNINLSAYTGTSFNIIGNDVNEFTGVFDGNGRTISNFTYSTTGTNYIGLFGYVDGPNAAIKDLGLINPNVAGGTGNFVGSLVGRIYRESITNCYVEGGNVSATNVGGLVGGSQGTITNCHSTATVTGDNYIGGLVGSNYLGTITNCYATGSVSGTGDQVGGLAGYDYRGTITNCYSTASVSGEDKVGGLVGWNDYGTITGCHSSGQVQGQSNSWNLGGLVGANCGPITNCYSTASVSIGALRIGGLVGWNGSGGTITNCYSTGQIQGGSEAGGLVGWNGSGGTITNCYSMASVSGTGEVGGLVGSNGAEISGSFWDTQTSGRSNMCGGSGTGCDDGYGKTTAEMQMASTFTSAGWDFVGEAANGTEDIWRMCNDDVNYPMLWWEFIDGDFSCPDGIDGSDLAVLCEQWLFELISADVAPNGGDGVVNFLDWADFAAGWQVTNDYDGLADFAEQWLKTGASYLIADIAPAPAGDEIVNGLDFAVLAENWLAGL